MSTMDMDAFDDWRERNPLKKWRSKHGVTQGQVALSVNKSVQAVRLWERGENQPASDALWSLATMIGVDVARLDKQWSRWWSGRPVLTP